MSNPKELTDSKIRHLAANATIYLMCWRDKGDIKYLQKAKDCIDKLLEFEGANNINASYATETKECWPQTTDAKILADEFCKLNTASDHGVMLGWFANAIMSGYDTAMAKSRSKEYHTNMLRQLQAESIPAPEAKPIEPLHFDLEAAKAGTPIMRRNGDKVRFVAFDEKLRYPLLIAFNMANDNSAKQGELLDNYPANGVHKSSKELSELDIVMVPVPMKECEGWVNLYKTSVGKIFTSEVCETPKECAAILSKYETYLGICRVTWTEKVERK